MDMPTKKDFEEFLRITTRLETFDAQSRVIRGYGALPNSDYPNQNYINVKKWLEELYNEL